MVVPRGGIRKLCGRAVLFPSSWGPFLNTNHCSFVYSPQISSSQCWTGSEQSLIKLTSRLCPVRQYLYPLFFFYPLFYFVSQIMPVHVVWYGLLIIQVIKKNRDILLIKCHQHLNVRNLNITLLFSVKFWGRNSSSNIIVSKTFMAKTMKTRIQVIPPFDLNKK